MLKAHCGLLMLCLISGPLMAGEFGKIQAIRTPYFSIEFRQTGPVVPGQAAPPLQSRERGTGLQFPHPLPPGPAVEELPAPPSVGVPRLQPGDVLIRPAPGPAATIVETPAPRSVYVPTTRYPTHAELAQALPVRAGNYDVVMLHPRTNQPVRVLFSLPHGRPKKIRVERDELEYDYGNVEVEIRFKRDGRVEVEYND